MPTQSHIIIIIIIMPSCGSVSLMHNFLADITVRGIAQASHACSASELCHEYGVGLPRAAVHRFYCRTPNKPTNLNRSLL